MKITKTNQSHIDEASQILVQAYYDSVDEAKKHLLSKIETDECYVALLDDKVVGVLTYIRAYSHYANYIDDVIVHEDHRRKGIASKLIKKYIEISREEQPKKQPYALSSTDVTNTPSKVLHKSIGFENLGIVKNLHYGKDEIIFGFKLF